MKKTLAIVAAILGALWLIANGVVLFYAADLVPLAVLLLAFGALSGGYGVALALLLTTNTRPGWLDPHSPLGDPFGETTDALLKHAVMIGDRPYGRRSHDDTAVVQRLIDRLEQDDSARPAPARAPDWALDLARDHEPHAAASTIFSDVREPDEHR